MVPETSPAEIPVLRPRLPTADDVLPYLRRIDETRVYSNHGPLTLEFEERAALELSLPRASFVSAASGTAALTGAILASAGRASPQRPLAIIPAFTFVATVCAVEQCGYVPHFVDVDAATWSLDAVALARAPVVERAGIVVPVAPFGRPQPQQDWREFQNRTALPVVIDGAASFDTARGPEFLGEIPIAMSFNATKAFATGEGGAVIANDADFTVRVRRALNFGFFRTRESRFASLNGKMSEYHAAVGLAELDMWALKRKTLEEVVSRYRRAAADEALSESIVTAPEVSLSYVLFRARDRDEAERVQDALRAESIATRRWYGFGVHREPYYQNVEHGDLAVTEAIAARLLGIPMAPDLSDENVGRIIRTIRSARSA